MLCKASSRLLFASRPKTALISRKYVLRTLLSTSTNKISVVGKKPLPTPAKMSTTVPPEDIAEESHATLIGKRFTLTAEVIASKIFWAGFGWQGSSIIADKLGFGAESLSFALTTGTGEALAVLTGHVAFYTLIKRSPFSQELATGLWLGTGTFCSGTAWQPTVNALVTLTGNNFPMTAAGTMVVCGSAFYVGLRLGRIIWGESFGMKVAAREYENLSSDAGLSIAVGGATAMFVACDPGMVSNYFALPFGVLETDSDIIGMLRAGAATSTGYGLVQAWQNWFPKGRNWMDLYLK